MESMMRLLEGKRSEGVSGTTLVLGIGLVLMVALVTACSQTPEECKTDTACKGERICSPEGRCVGPQSGAGASDAGGTEGPGDASAGDSAVSTPDTGDSGPKDVGRPDVTGEGDATGETGSLDTSTGDDGPEAGADRDVGDGGGCVPAEEACDGLDNDCDGRVDEELTRRCGSSVGQCQQGTSTCDRGSWGACTGQTQSSPERCDGLDNDCDGEVDEGVKTTYFRDGDSDGFGASGDTYEACKPPSGYVANDRDCDDGDAEVNPTAPEVCDGKDNDCSMTVDPGCKCQNGASRPCGTSQGVCQKGSQACVQGTWGSCTGGTMPGSETCNGKDDDCDGKVDEGVKKTFYRDADGDSFGDKRDQTEACTQPANGNWVPKAGDCDDSSKSVNPKASESCNGVDDDCDGAVDGLTKSCGTSAGICSKGTSTCTVGKWGACQGNTPPKKAETCGDKKDNDCDGQVDESCPFLKTLRGKPVDLAVDSKRTQVYVLEKGYLTKLQAFDLKGQSKWTATPRAKSFTFRNPNAVEVGPGGYVYSVGTADHSHQRYDIALAKYNLAGGQKWIRTYEGGKPNNDGKEEGYGLAVALNGKGNPELVMSAVGKYASRCFDNTESRPILEMYDPQTNFSRAEERFSRCSSRASAYVLAASPTGKDLYFRSYTSGTYARIDLGKFNASKSKTTVHKTFRPSQDGIYAGRRGLAATKDGVYFAGAAGTSYGLYGVKGGRAGYVHFLKIQNGMVASEWKSLVDGANNEQFTSIAAAPNGHTFACGYTESGGLLSKYHGKKDAFCVELDAAGKKVWTWSIGSTEDDRVRGVEVTPGGAVYVFGTTRGVLSGMNYKPSNVDGFWGRIK